MMNASYKPIRQFMYEFHRLGLDKMSTKPEEGKAAMTKSLDYLKQVNSERPNLLFIQVLTDTKRNEWKSIYSEGNQQDKTKAVNVFREIDPSHASEYEEILSGRR